MTAAPPNFNRIAAIYRWLEYGSFGTLLERCRFHQLPRLTHAQHALVLGDGDGRFAARLLAGNPGLTADVVDASAAMLALCAQRFARLRIAGRATLIHRDIRAFIPEPGTRYDLVATHFFLDCLSTQEIDELAARLKPFLTPDARWVISEFAIPQTAPIRWFAHALVRSLYVAFRFSTGLRAVRLPAHAAVLRNTGFYCADSSTILFGVLRSELWQLPFKEQATARAATDSH